MKAEDIKPLSDRVLVEVADAETMTAAGIIIPDTAQEKPKRGIVLAVGPTVSQVKTGDAVLYAKVSGARLEYNNKELLIMREGEIIAVI